MPLTVLAFAAVTLLPAGTQTAAVRGELLVDPLGTYTIGEVMRPPLANDFVLSERAVALAPSNVYWIRFALLRARDASTIWYLVDGPGNEAADLYVPQPGGATRLIRFGEAIPLARRPFPSSHPRLAVSDDMTRGKTLYLRVRTYGGPPAIPIVETDAGAYASASTNDAIAGMFAGFLLAIALSSLFLTLRLRDRTYLFNAFLMLAAAAGIINGDYLSPILFWPSTSVNGFWIFQGVWAVYLLALLLFMRSFLELPRRLPGADRVLIAVFSLTILYQLYTTAQPHSPLTVFRGFWVPVPVQYIPLFATGFAITILAWRAGVRAARFFAFGFFGLSFAFAYNLLDIFGFAPARIPLLSDWGVELGIAFDATMFQLALADRFFLERRARERAQAERIATLESYNLAVARFIPHAFLDELGRSDITALALGDHAEREMTVLFADIRNFSTLAESWTPQATFDFLNDYFARAGPIVRQRGGFVDKYVGDGVMALFPGPAEDGLGAAIALTRAASIAIGTGLHRGRLMLGTIGESERFETTVVADAVNIAARLESATRTFGCSILLSSRTVEALHEPGGLGLRCLGTLRVKGKTQELVIYEAFDADPPDLAAHKRDTMQSFAQALAAFSAGNYPPALEAFRAILSANRDDGPARYYVARCEAALTGMPSNAVTR